MLSDENGSKMLVHVLIEKYKIFIQKYSGLHFDGGLDKLWNFHPEVFFWIAL